MASEAVSLLRSFYEQGNPNAPKPHRPLVHQGKKIEGKNTIVLLTMTSHEFTTLRSHHNFTFHTILMTTNG
ncbi:hypothetical protein L1049_009357 [Liquidambar formosana]|uniref:Uncharacterized protein n=1 Tax=Liquidambar formosana TaxID=63359 RepID=A0AAP0SC32_LIQFO